jgi:predicted Ser/Thr protein kinase
LQLILKASALPVSIIIFGVGNGEFTAMDELGSDTAPLVYNGVQAERNIVNFVPFRDYQRLNNVSKEKAYLTREVLVKIEDQVVGYMKSRNIKPNHHTLSNQ